ncbi:hypothetical protein [Vibrio lentus]|uniref:hypothetical protein n=1 Tax=Vibrio lentus TaxID=136468 RepID=UPI0010BDEFB5|nr:hypothetical protein [Vibrio lentus]TKG17743.1 hypothetical protein FCW05_12615 [Vibrio lentus]
MGLIFNREEETSNEPMYDPNHQVFLDDLYESLSNTEVDPYERVSGQPVYDSLLGDASDVANFQDWLKGGGYGDSVKSVGEAVYSQEYVQSMADQTAAMLGQSFAGIDASAAQTGNMGSSRAALAQGSAAGQASSALQTNIMEYQQETMDTAQQGVNNVIEMYGSTIGQEGELLHSVRQYMQNDESARFMQDLLSQNPALIQAMLYGMAASSGPVGSSTG